MSPSASRPPIRFTISIDTEEDNWEPAVTGVTTRNIAELPRLQAMFSRLGVRATYFTSYQVAADRESAAIMRDLHAADGVEIGAHLHPWNTPPMSGLEPTLSMLMSYPEQVQEQKLARLIEVLRSTMDVEPRAFRAGRFGVGRDTFRVLARLGIRTDSSITPLLSWEREGGPTFLDAQSTVYRLDPDGDPFVPSPHGELIEVPVSVGFTRLSPTVWPALARVLDSALGRRLRIAGVASRVLDVSRVILSPETESVTDMVRVSRQMIAHGATHLHMYFHSSSLVPGLTPFAATASEVRAMFRSIETYVESLAEMATIHFCTVSEVSALTADPRSDAMPVASKETLT